MIRVSGGCGDPVCATRVWARRLAPDDAGVITPYGRCSAALRET